MQTFLARAVITFMCVAIALVAGAFTALWNPFAAVAVTVVVYVALFWVFEGDWE